MQQIVNQDIARRVARLERALQRLERVLGQDAVAPSQADRQAIASYERELAAGTLTRLDDDR